MRSSTTGLARSGTSRSVQTTSRPTMTPRAGSYGGAAAAGFPAQAGGTFRSLVSGDGFSCALEANASVAVRYWGPCSSAVQAAFANATSCAN